MTSESVTQVLGRGVHLWRGRMTKEGIDLGASELS
jgi:hypothetical protein